MARVDQGTDADPAKGRPVNPSEEHLMPSNNDRQSGVSRRDFLVAGAVAGLVMGAADAADGD